MMELLGIVATVLAIAGVLLNNRLNRACFILWLISNGMSCLIHAVIGCWSLTVRDAIFFVLAIQGYVLWGKKRK